MKVKFSKNTTESVWYKCYYFYVNDNYGGWIAKYDKDMDYDLYSTKFNIKRVEFKTLNDAKRYVREVIKLYK